MNIDLVLKRLELIKEGKGIGTISDIEASIILKEIENLHKIIDGMIDNEEEYCLEINRLNNIINEAIKYIEEAQEKDEDKESCSLYIPKLLEILKGE